MNVFSSLILSRTSAKQSVESKCKSSLTKKHERLNRHLHDVIHVVVG